MVRYFSAQNYKHNYFDSFISGVWGLNRLSATMQALNETNQT